MAFVRTLVALLIGSALALSGCNFQVGSKLLPLEQGASLEKAFGGPVAQQVQVGEGVVALSPERAGKVGVAYLVKKGLSYELVGGIYHLESAGAAKLTLQKGYVVLETLKDGAPQLTGFTVDPVKGLSGRDYYPALAPEPANKKGHHVTINKHLNVLWHYNDGKLVKTYRVATGRDKGPLPTWSDYKTNYTTPEGSFRLTNFIENPGYTTLKPGEKNYAGGHPENPLGTRWMGFPALGGNDSGGIYAIHGTSEPEKIGTWASDGCIRMYSHEAEELFAILKGKNATLLIIGGAS